MKIRIGCVDGKTYESVEISREYIQEALDSNNGYLGDGSSRTRIDSVEEAMEFLVGFCKYDKRNNSQYFSMEVEQGDPSFKRTFNVKHIVWWEVVPDSEF